MYTISNLPEYIYIGNSKGIYSVAIDVSLWIDLYGTSDINIYFIPPDTNEDNGYFVNITITNGILTWNVQEQDIGVIGRGYCIIILNGNNKIKKSDTIIVVIQ